MNMYFINKDVDGRHLYIGAVSEKVALDIAFVAFGTRHQQWSIRQLTKRDTSYEVFAAYFENQQGQGYADIKTLLKTAADIHDLKFIPYKTRQEKIDELLLGAE